jgi:hypothetical protein
VATYYGWKNKFGGMDVNEARRLRALEAENRRLKNLVADQAVQISILKEVNSKKVVSPSQKRRAIKHVIEQGQGTTAEACRALDLRDECLNREILGAPEPPRLSHRPPSALRFPLILFSRPVHDFTLNKLLKHAGFSNFYFGQSIWRVNPSLLTTVKSLCLTDLLFIH